MITFLHDVFIGFLYLAGITFFGVLVFACVNSIVKMWRNSK